MPEMDAGIARDYIRTIGSIVRRGFLSINQEAMAPAPGGAQHWVHDLARSDGSLVCRSRSRWWMEQGYVEELYEPRGATSFFAATMRWLGRGRDRDRGRRSIAPRPAAAPSRR